MTKGIQIAGCRALPTWLLLIGCLILAISKVYALPEVKISAGDAEADDRFGSSVSIDGDYAIVGAYWEDPGGVNDAGSAYIFHRSGENWIQQAKINAGDAEEGDWFGYSVSISGDYAIVGAVYEDPGDVAQAGSAYIFHRSGENWTQQAKINAGDAEESDQFGISVSINGDYTLIGAVWESPGGVEYAGSAYIFHRSGENWTQQAKISAGDAEGGDEFGHSVSINGDYTIVGALFGDGTGSAYIFHRSGENWTQQAKIIAGDAEENDYFGVSVSIDGDYVIVGAVWGDAEGISDPGAAYIFHRSGENWTQQAKINASDAEELDYFGYSVSIKSDYIIVTAPEELQSAGSAYIYHRFGENWTQQAKINASDAQANDDFGFFVSINDDYVIVGAWQEDPGGVDGAGSGYVYRHRVPNVTPRDKYVMLGIPCTVDDGNAAVLFQDDFNNAAPGYPRWRVSRYDAADGWYERYGEGAHQDIPDFAPGLGFWMAQSVVDNCILDIEADHLLDFVAEDADFSVPIDRDPAGATRGLTQIANPFFNTYDWSQTTITHSESGTVPIATAAGNGWMDGHLYVWDPDLGAEGAYTVYEFNGDNPKSMAVWLGGWVESYLADYDLTVNFTVAGIGGMPRRPGGNGGTPNRDDDEGWALQLGLQSVDGSYIDMDNRAAVHPVSDEGWDMYDAREFTPMSDSYAHLYFPHTDREFRPGLYTWDYRSMDFEAEQVWEFTVKVVNLPNREFSLSWQNIGEIDYHYFFSLENEDGERLCDLRATEGYTFRSGDAETQEINFRLVVAHYPQGVEGGSDFVANEFGIMSINPNPFNSSTAITYGLAEASNATLAVFDIAGHRVETLLKGYQQPGVHKATLNATDLPSGLYFARLEASGKVFIRKAMLIR